MKKLFIVILFVTFVFEAWAEKEPYLVTEQFVASSWFRYIKSDTLTITAKNRTQKVRYCFAVKGATDSDSAIDCRIAFPKDIDVDFLSCSGILKIGTSGKKSILMETSYIDGRNRYFEFLIPQQDKVKGFVELSLTIPYYYKNKSIPVAVNYECLRKTEALNSAIAFRESIIASNTIVAGSCIAAFAISPVVTTVLATTAALAILPFKLIANTLTASEVDSSSGAHNTVQNIFSQLKISRARSPLYSSSARFTLHIK